MSEVVNIIIEALNKRLKNPSFEVKLTIFSHGYLQPLLVSFDLEYSMKSGERAHVSAEALVIETLAADEKTISKIMADLNHKYQGRSRR